MHDALGTPHLEQIIDAAGIASTVGYNDIGWPVTLITPYGTTSFTYQYWDENWEGDRYRRIDITEPNEGKQIYLFKGRCDNLWGGGAWLPAAFDSSLVPPQLPHANLLDNGPQWLNTFYWNQKQSVGLPSDPALLTVTHMNKARMRHWLDASGGAGAAIADPAVSLEIAPSMDDGVTRGQITWYGYDGKTSPCSPGTNSQPSLLARRLPDGSTWYQYYQLNSFGHPTSKTTTYGSGNPAPTRTYSYVYAANDQDLLEIRRPGDELVTSFTYNGRHQVLTETRWADATTSYTDTWTYDTQGRPETFTSAAGQTRTYSYASSGAYAGYLSSIAETPVTRSESFTWLNGYVRTHTDHRGLTLTFTRDNLGRLTQVDYPAHDGMAASSVTYSYALQPGEGFNMC